MIAGSIGAVVHGSVMPVFFLLFGDMVNGFGKNQSELKKMTEKVAKYALYFAQWRAWLVGGMREEEGGDLRW
uniref:Uncharacterized protein n=1 Tax=Nelumbo nucifera TaxID=4432 RepID=A0A822ZPS7_NELNU|nr:TPA_asm: hypothetical protein HUJ06_003156 [Nelumbo nucifera]